MDRVETVRGAVREAGGEVVDIRTEEPSLEAVFLSLAGRAKGQERTGAALRRGPDR